MDDEKEYEKTVRQYHDRLKAVQQQSSRQDAAAAAATGTTTMASATEDEEDIQVVSTLEPQPSHSRREQEIKSEVSSSDDDDERRSDVHSRVHQLGEFSSLHRYFVYVAKHKQGKSPEEANELGLQWVQCWQILGYTYRNLLANVAKADQLVTEHMALPTELPRKLWEKLNKNREKLPQNVSVSFVVDRTIEHYRLVIAKRMKEREVMDRSHREVKVEQTQLPKQEEKHQVQLESKQEEQQYEVSSSQATPVHNLDASCSNLASDAVQVEKDFSDFMFQKLGSMIGNPQGTVIAMDAVSTAIKQAKIHPTTLLAWFDIDMENSSDRQLIHFSDLMDAYLRPSASFLPNICQLETLTSHIVEFCYGSSFREKFKTSDNYAAFAAAVQVLKARLPVQSAATAGTSVQIVKFASSPTAGPSSPPSPSSSVAPFSPEVAPRRPKSRKRRRRNRSSSSSSSSIRSESAGRRDHSLRSPVPASGYCRSPSPDRRKVKSPHPQKLDARSFSFTFGRDSQLHEQRGHPLYKQKPLVGEIVDYLKVYCHIDVFGEGLQHVEVIQIGACLEDGKKEFLAPLVPSQAMHKDVWHRLGYRTPDRGRESTVSFFHPSYEEEVRCLSLMDALTELAEYLQYSLRKTDFDGVVLIFGHRECLTYLMQAMTVCKSSSLKSKFSIVAGYAFLEDSVRENYLKNCDGDVRLPLDLAWRIVFGTSKRRLDAAADGKAVGWSKIGGELDRCTSRKKRKRKKQDDIYKRLEEEQWVSYQDYFSRLSSYKSLRRFVAAELANCGEWMELRDIFQLFPNVACQERFVGYLDVPRTVAAGFVGCLVAFGISIDSLVDQEKILGSNEHFSVLKTATLMKLPTQGQEVVQIFEDCIAATLKWLAGKNTAHRRHPKETLLRSSSVTSVGSSTRQSSSGRSGPKTPPPAESPREAQFTGRYKDLFEHLKKILRRREDSGGNKSALVPKIAREMVQLWIKAGYAADTLVLRATDKNVLADTTREQFLFTLSKREELFPSSWNGYGLEFLIQQTMELFAEAESQRVAPLIPDGSAIDALLAEQRCQSSSSSSEKTRSLGAAEQQSLKELGLDKAKRKFAQSDIKLLRDFLGEYPAAAKSLEEICVDIQPSFPMWADTIPRIIIIDLLKLLMKSNLSVASICHQLQHSQKAEVTKRQMAAGVFGAQLERRKTGGGYKGMSDFDIYRDLLDHLMHCLDPGLGVDAAKRNFLAAKRRGCQETEAGGRKRRRREMADDDDESMNQDEYDDDDECDLEPPRPPTAEELMANLNKVTKDIYSRYLRGRNCPAEFRDLNEYIYFHRSLRKARASLPDLSLSKVANDVTNFLLRKGVGHSDLLAEMGASGVEGKTGKSIHDALRIKIGLCGDAATASSVPTSCREVAGALVSIITSYYEQEVRSVVFSPFVGRMEFDHKDEDENGLFLRGLHEYVAQCLAEELNRMVETKEVENVSLEDVRVEGFAELSLKLVDFVRTVGFDLKAGIDRYENGTLSESVRNLLKHHADKVPDKFPLVLLTRLCFEWVDATIKQKSATRLPAATTVRTAMKCYNVLQLQARNNLVSAEKSRQIVVNLTLPASIETAIMDHQMNLASDQALPPDYLVSDLPEREEDHRVESDKDKETTEDATPVKPDVKDDDEDIGDVFITKFGLALTPIDICIQAKCKKVVKLSLCGLPRLKVKAKLTIVPVTDALVRHKIDLELANEHLMNDLTIYVGIVNGNDETVNIPAKEVLVKVKVKDAADSNVITPPLPPDAFAMRLIRHYFLICGTDGMDDDGEYVHFGHGFHTEILRSCKTRFRVSRSQLLGRLELYNVGSVVFFLKNYRDQDYQAYLQACLVQGIPGIDFVRRQDSVSMHDYLSGLRHTVPELKRQRLLSQEDLKGDIKLSQPEEPQDREDASALQIVDVRYPNTLTEKKEFTREIEKMVLVIEDKMDVPTDVACQRLETLLKMIHAVDLSLARIRFEAFTSSIMRQVYEDGIVAKFVAYHRQHPDLFDNIKVLTNEACLRGIAITRKLAHVKCLIALAKLFSSDPEASDLHQELTDSASKSKNNLVSWTQKARQLLLTFPAAVTSQMLQVDKIEDDRKVLIYVACNDRIISYLMVVDSEKEVQDFSLIAAQSCYLPEYELHRPRSYKIGKAATWAANENSHLLKGGERGFTIVVDDPDVTNLFCPSDEVKEGLSSGQPVFSLEGFSYEFVILPDTESNPAEALCSRDLSEQPYFSNISLLRELLAIAITCLCRHAKVKQNRKRLARIRSRRRMQEKYRESRRVEAGPGDDCDEVDVEEDLAALDELPAVASPSSDMTSLSSSDDGDGGERDLVQSRELQPLLKDFKKLFMRRGEDTRTAKLKAFDVVESIAKADITDSCLAHLFLDKGRGDEDSDDRLHDLQNFIMHRKVNVPRSLSVDAFYGIIHRHYSERQQQQQRHPAISSPVADDIVSSEEADDSNSPSLEPVTSAPSSPRQETTRDWYAELLSEGVSDLSRDQTPGQLQRWDGGSSNPSSARTKTRSFVPLMLYYDKMLQGSNPGGTSSLDLICCWLMVNCDFTQLTSIYNASIEMGKTEFIRQLSQLLDSCPSSATILGDKDNFLNLTYDFFTAQNELTDASTCLEKPEHSAKHKKTLADLQGVYPTVAEESEFRGLAQFYKDILRQVVALDADNAVAASIKCVQTWQLFGLTFPAVELLCTASAANDACLKAFLAKCSVMFEELSCFLDEAVDSKRLVEYTVMYFRSILMLQDITDDGQEQKDSFLPLRGKVILTVSSTLGREDEEANLCRIYDDVSEQLISRFCGWTRLKSLLSNIRSTAKGIPGPVVRLATQHGLLSLLPPEDSIFPCDTVMRILDALLKIEEEEEGEMDMEEGEVLSDDDDEEEEDKEKKKKECPAEESAAAVFHFESIDFAENEETTIVEKVNFAKICARYIQQNKQQQHKSYKEIGAGTPEDFVDVGKYSFRLGDLSNVRTCDSDSRYYTVQSVALFANYIDDTHEGYVEKVTRDHPGVGHVHQSDRENLKKYLLGEETGKLEDPAVVDSDFLTDAVRLTRELRRQRLAQRFQCMTASRSVALVKEAINSQQHQEEFPGLFAKLFKSAYNCGMETQRNWQDVSRLASCELVQCWIVCGFSFPQLLKTARFVRKGEEQDGTLVGERCKKALFRLLYDLLLGHRRELPPCLHLPSFVKKTIEFCLEILEEEEDEEKEERPLDAADVTATSSQDLELEGKENEEELESLDLETLRQKRLELEADIAAGKEDEEGDSDV